MEETPFVSIVTPTRNRSKFLEASIKMMSNQTYPHDRMEWIIVDDSDTITKYPKEVDGIKVKYYHKKKMSLAKKRDLLNSKSNGKYIICWDDDDYYPPCRVLKAVETLNNTPCHIVGTTVMPMFFTKDGKLRLVGGHNKYHATAGTMAYTKEYTLYHKFYDLKSEGKGQYGEESVFTENFVQPLKQLIPVETIVAISHGENTVDKTFLLEPEYKSDKLIGELKERLEDLVTDESLIEFYRGLGYSYKPTWINEKLRRGLLP
jgi:glycosyltransferase involved in cell wall biosynthesis